MPGPGVFPGMCGDGMRRGEGLVVGEGFIPPGMFAVTGGFRGAGDAAPYVGGCPLTGGCANLRRGVCTPPYGCNSRKHCRGGIYAARGCGHPLMGRSVGRGLDPSTGVCGRHRACPPPRGRGRACPARGWSRGWAATGCGGGGRVGCRGGIYPSRCICGDGRFPGRRGRRPLRGWPPVDGWLRELSAGCGHPALRMLFT